MFAIHARACTRVYVCVCLSSQKDDTSSHDYISPIVVMRGVFDSFFVMFMNIIAGVCTAVNDDEISSHLLRHL